MRLAAVKEKCWREAVGGDGGGGGEGSGGGGDGETGGSEGSGEGGGHVGRDAAVVAAEAVVALAVEIAAGQRQLQCHEPRHRLRGREKSLLCRVSNGNTVLSRDGVK